MSGPVKTWLPRIVDAVEQHTPSLSRTIFISINFVGFVEAVASGMKDSLDKEVASYEVNETTFNLKVSLIEWLSMLYTNI